MMKTLLVVTFLGTVALSELAYAQQKVLVRISVLKNGKVDRVEKVWVPKSEVYTSLPGSKQKRQRLGTFRFNGRTYQYEWAGKATRA